MPVRYLWGLSRPTAVVKDTGGQMQRPRLALRYLHVSGSAACVRTPTASKPWLMADPARGRLGPMLPRMALGAHKRELARKKTERPTLRPGQRPMENIISYRPPTPWLNSTG